MVQKIKIQNLNSSELKDLFDKNKESVTLICYDWDKHCDVKKDLEFLRIPQFTEENPLVVEDYPYGSYRTQIKYYIETTKRGDRFCYQTLNPRKKIWNKPKKTVYNAVMIMYVNNLGHIVHTSLDFNANEFNLKNKFDTFKEFFTEKQKVQLAEVFGYTEVMKSVKFEIRPKLLDEESQIIQEKEQAVIKSRINNAIVNESQKSLENINKECC